MMNCPITNPKLKDHFEAANGLSSLHLLSHDLDTDTVTYEERISTPAAVGSEAIVMEPKTTTAQLWIGMTDGEAE